jgi:hypothetical protein
MLGCLGSLHVAVCGDQTSTVHLSSTCRRLPPPSVSTTMQHHEASPVQHHAASRVRSAPQCSIMRFHAVTSRNLQSASDAQGPVPGQPVRLTLSLNGSTSCCWHQAHTRSFSDVYSGRYSCRTLRSRSRRRESISLQVSLLCCRAAAAISVFGCSASHSCVTA